jgi:hypothetical protein
MQTVALLLRPEGRHGAGHAGDTTRRTIHSLTEDSGDAARRAFRPRARHAGIAAGASSTSTAPPEIWRRDAIADAGGWQHDTLTETWTSATARSCAAGSSSSNDHVAPANLPVEMNAFKSQQHRWGEGIHSDVLKLMPRILQIRFSRQRSKSKRFLTCQPTQLPLMCVLSVLMAPSMTSLQLGWYEMLLIDIPLFFRGNGVGGNFYMVCQRELYPAQWTSGCDTCRCDAIGIGLAVNNTKAVLEALFDKPQRVHAHAEIRHRAQVGRLDGKKYHQIVAVQPMIEWRLGFTSPARSSTRSPTASMAPCRS